MLRRTVTAVVAFALLAFAPAAMADRPSAQGWGDVKEWETASAFLTISPDGAVSGTLPPGYSQENPPDVPGDPSIAAAIKAAPEGAIRTVEFGEAEKVAPRTFSTASTVMPFANPDGCVWAEATISPAGISYGGYMTRCRHGNLGIATFLRADGATVQGAMWRYCNNTTGCRGIDRTYTGTPGCRIFTNWAEGKNYTTGGHSMASQAWRNASC